MEQHILVVLPHPDDESFGISGTLAMHIQRGTTVTYACLTLGEMGRSMGNPIIANRETLPGIRRKELELSCQCIGIQDLRMLGLTDKTIEFEDQDALDQRIAAIIQEVNPSLVITFYPGYSVHPDHDACGAAVIRTIARMPEKERPKVHCIAFSKGCENEIGKPNIIVDVHEYIENKMGSLQAHRTQFALFDNQDFRDRMSMERFWEYRFE